MSQSTAPDAGAADEGRTPPGAAAPTPPGYAYGEGPVTGSPGAPSGGSHPPGATHPPGAPHTAAAGAYAAAPAPPAEGIVVERVSRSFGSVHAVRDLSLTAPRGAVTALVGPNGCGKSTLMLMLASLLAPHAGRVLIDGIDPAEDSAAVRAKVGWMPDQFGAWDSLRVSEVLTVMGQAYFLPTADLRVRVQELLDLMDLDSLAQQPAHVLSRGQKQRLGLARALVHSPSVLILDEPASGLDPASRRRLLRVVREAAQQGSAVLISSHILTELEEMADHVVFLDAGHAVEASSLRDLASRPRPWRVSSLDEGRLIEALRTLGVGHEGVIEPSRSPSGHAEVTIPLPDEATAARLLRDLAAHDAAVIGFAPATGRLEAAYLATDAAHRQGAL